MMALQESGEMYRETVYVRSQKSDYDAQRLCVTAVTLPCAQ